MKRRRFIKSETLGLVGIGFTSGFYAWQVESFWLEFVKKKMPIKKLHNSLIGKTLMQISDIHIGGWVLSGHTHGGQCKPPFLNPPLLPVKNKKYSSGEISLDDGGTLYINRALGHLWQVRFNVRPEITIFELEKV